MKNIVLLLVIKTVMFTLCKTYAQKPSQVFHKQLEANKFFQEENYASALALYLELDTIAANKYNYDFNIAISYLHVYNHKQALEYILKCKGQENEHGEVLNYYIGKIYQLEYQLDSAIAYYNKYLSALNSTNNKSKTIVPEIEYEIVMCENAKEAIKAPKNIEIVNSFSTINTPYNEYGAQLSGDEKTLIFTSGRPYSSGGAYDANDGTYFDDIYISHFIDSSWSNPEPISNKINTEHHEASVALSHDGHKLIFYRYASTGLSRPSGDLYYSEFINNEWSSPIRFDKPLNSKNWEPSACFSLDDREIFFVSDRKGGYGGTDIYRVKQNKNGKWGKPKNLGPTINTPYNEDAPFLHPDGKTFYFSSQGHQSIGGYDLFKAQLDSDNSTFTMVENLGYPINTTGDDSDFTISSNGQHLYFSSDRPEGKGNKDLYAVYLPYIEKNLLQLTGRITGNDNNQPLDVTIYIKGTRSDGTTLDRVSSSNLNLEGKYVVLLNEGYEYLISFKSKGYQTKTIKLNTTLLEGFNQQESSVVLSPLIK